MHTQIYTRTFECTCMYLLMYTHAYIYILVYEHMYVPAQIHMHNTQAYRYIYPYINILMPIYTCIYKFRHTNPSINIGAYAYILLSSQLFFSHSPHMHALSCINTQVCITHASYIKTCVYHIHFMNRYIFEHIYTYII